MRVTMSVDDGWRRLDHHQREQVCEWLRSIGGDPDVTSELMVGEGYVVAREYLVDPLGKKIVDVGTLAQRLVSYETTTLPPCWENDGG